MSRVLSRGREEQGWSFGGNGNSPIFQMNLNCWWKATAQFCDQTHKTRSLLVYSRQTMSHILSYMSYILFSFPTPHIILDSKDLWASLVQKEWVLLQWALLWEIVDTRPVSGSRDSEEEGQVSVGVSDHCKKLPSLQLDQYEFSKSVFKPSKIQRWFTVILGWDGDPCQLADHKSSHLPPLEPVTSSLWCITTCCFRFANSSHGPLPSTGPLTCFISW